MGVCLRIPDLLKLVACAILILTATTSVDAATVQVRSDLQAAIDLAKPGDTLLVEPGVYGKIEIRKSLNLLGQGAMIRASDREPCVRVLADDVSISGFTIRDGFYGISLEEVEGCKISNNTVIHCTQPGIMLKFADKNLIEHNNASFNGLGGEGWYGIYLSNSNQNLIQYNVASNNGAYGINLFPSCSNNTILGNVLERNMYGLYMFTDCSDNIIESNTMSRNTNSGIDMRFNCHDNSVLNNTIQRNVVAGITLMDSGQNKLEGNKISENQRYGIQIQGESNGNTISNNAISESQTGIYLDASDNLLYGNRLLENVAQAQDRGANTWNAEYPEGGNLWSDYIGEDVSGGIDQDEPGSDGFGDTPYKVNSESSDRYPIMGGQVRPITVIEKSISPSRAKVGETVFLKVRLGSKYGLSQVACRALNSDGEQASGGYVRMIQDKSGDLYQGNLVTALMDPGTYEITLRASDRRGYELVETLGTVEILSRGG
jgi:nitrous oxidase accessory protein